MLPGLLDGLVDSLVNSSIVDHALDYGSRDAVEDSAVEITHIFNTEMVSNRTLAVQDLNCEGEDGVILKPETDHRPEGPEDGVGDALDLGAVVFMVPLWDLDQLLDHSLKVLFLEQSGVESVLVIR